MSTRNSRTIQRARSRRATERTTAFTRRPGGLLRGRDKLARSVAEARAQRLRLPDEDDDPACVTRPRVAEGAARVL